MNLQLPDHLQQFLNCTCGRRLRIQNAAFTLDREFMLVGFCKECRQYCVARKPISEVMSDILEAKHIPAFDDVAWLQRMGINGEGI